MITEKDQWIGVVRPLLARIRADAAWIKHHAAEIRDKVRRLPYQPDFETEAQSAIDDALKDVTAAEQYLQEARIAFMAKPVRK